MYRIAFLIVILVIVLTACSTSKDNSIPMNQNISTDLEVTPVTSIVPSNLPTNTEETKTDEEKEQELLEKLKRKGDLDLNHIKIVGVDGSLLKTIMTYLEAIKEKDDKKRLSTIYAPDYYSDSLNNIEPYILAVTGLTLDNHRVKAVTEWFGLDKIADKVVIVNLEYRTLNRYLEKNVSSGDYIFISVNGHWKLYENQ